MHVMPTFRRELNEELSGLRRFDEVTTVITKVRAAGSGFVSVLRRALEVPRRSTPDRDPLDQVIEAT